MGTVIKSRKSSIVQYSFEEIKKMIEGNIRFPGTIVIAYSLERAAYLVSGMLRMLKMLGHIEDFDMVFTKAGKEVLVEVRINNEVNQFTIYE